MENKVLQTLNVREKDKQAIEKFIETLISKFHEDLMTVLIYGSAVKDNYFPGSSDLNIMVVFKTFNSAHLKVISPIVKGFRGRDRISALVLGYNEILDSADVFPIRFLDIKQHHQLLYGTDLFADLVIETRHLRYELERQVRNINMRLRQMYMHSNYTAAELRDMIVSDLSGFTHHMATLLYLFGEEPPVKKEDIIARSAEVFGVDANVLNKIIALKKGGNTPPKSIMEELFDAYLQTVGKIEDMTDKLKIPDGA
ncbi:MAG: hypothetical protein LWY06_00380 [Firmicutes bacterium]|nr:hypothetical protein [Bacillota bacterium]